MKKLDRYEQVYSTLRTLIAGVAGGVALNLAMLSTFRLIGFGWAGGGILLDPSLQSPKLIRVWTQLERTAEHRGNLAHQSLKLERPFRYY